MKAAPGRTRRYGCLRCVLCVVWALQRVGEYGFGNDESPANVKAEFYWSRLAYSSGMADFGAPGAGAGASWSRDYPKADHDCLIAHAAPDAHQLPSPLNVVALDSDHIFNYPWIYAVQVHNWTLHRRGGQTPARLSVEGRLPDGRRFPRHRRLGKLHGRHAPGAAQPARRRSAERRRDLSYVLYDIDDKIQIPGEQYVWTGRTYEKDGYQPKWRAIRDEKGRIIVAICHNMHLGDAWEWADDPNIRRHSRRWHFAWAWTTSSTA